MHDPLMFEGEAEDVVRCNPRHSEEGVWRRPREVRDIRHHRGEGLFKLIPAFTMCLCFYGFPLPPLATLGGHLFAGLPALCVVLFRSSPSHVS